jgi:hypothetical protein
MPGQLRAAVSAVGFRLAGTAAELYRGTASSPSASMTTFNKIFCTERLLQIIVVLGATVLMKLYS